MKISKAISPKVTGLSTLEPSPVAEKSAPVETPPQAISVPVDPSTQLGARKRGLAASSLLQSTLRGKEQMPVGAGMLSFLGGANSEKNILKALGTLGIKGESLKDPGVQQGLRDVRSAAGFAPGALDGEETMTSLMMAMAQKDRAVGAGPQSGVGDFNMNRVTAVDVENWKPGKSDVSADHLVEIGKKGKMSVNADVAKDVAPHLNAAMAEGNIDTPEKKAAFVAQTIFESGGYRYREALNNVAGSGGRATTEAQSTRAAAIFT